MIVTVFRARLRPEHAGEFNTLALDIGAQAEAMPGFVSRKVFTAEDGERVTIVEFASREAHDAWAQHAPHRAAQQLGRERFYSEYKIQVCELVRERSFNEGLNP
jgi:heme-degrading monooxygenase HmoA